MKARFHSEVNPRVKDMASLMKLTQRDMNDMATAVDIQFAKHEKRLFATEGSSGGAKWRPLSDSYAKAKARKFPGRKILQRVGRLRKGLSNVNDSDHVKTTRLKPRATIEVGTRNIVGAYQHDMGRDPLQQTRRQERRLFEKVAEYLAEVKLDRLRRALAAWRSRPRPRRGLA